MVDDEFVGGFEIDLVFDLGIGGQGEMVMQQVGDGWCCGCGLFEFELCLILGGVECLLFVFVRYGLVGCCVGQLNLVVFGVEEFGRCVYGEFLYGVVYDVFVEIFVVQLGL